MLSYSKILQFVSAYLLLLHLLFDLVLLVLAAFVLKPDAYDARRQARHLDNLLLHQGIRPWIGIVEIAVCAWILLS